MDDYFDWLCVGMSITLLSVDEREQHWRCDRCGREFTVTKEMLEAYSPRVYTHIRREPVTTIPQAFYEAFSDD